MRALFRPLELARHSTELAKIMELAQVIAAVKQRLYALDDEYEWLQTHAQLGRFTLPDERFWGIDLGDNQVLFCNSPLEWMGSPRAICGMVGVHRNHVVDSDQSIVLFKKAGKAAIDYYHKKPVETEGPKPEMYTMKKKELLEYAEELQLALSPRFTKEQIRACIEQHLMKRAE